MSSQFSLAATVPHIRYRVVDEYSDAEYPLESGARGPREWRSGPDVYRRRIVQPTASATTAERELSERAGSRALRGATVYQAAGGEGGLLRLARAWHARVMADDVVSHAFSHGFKPDHSERLAAYWAEALGGPTTYSDRYGDETSVVRIHSGNGPHEEMDRRAIACFDQAMTDVGLRENARVRAVLHDYFAWATTSSLSRYHRSADDVPDGLRIPCWSWDGLQR